METLAFNDQSYDMQMLRLCDLFQNGCKLLMSVILVFHAFTYTNN